MAQGSEVCGGGAGSASAGLVSRAAERLADPGYAERVREWVEASCRAQGVPVKIEDRRVLAEVAELLLGARGRGGDRDGGQERPERSVAGGADLTSYPTAKTGAMNVTGDAVVLSHAVDG